MNIFIISYVQEAIPPFCIYLIQIWDANLRAELDLSAREDSHSVAEHLTLRAKDSHWTWSYLLYELGTIYFGNGARTWGLLCTNERGSHKMAASLIIKECYISPLNFTKIFACVLSFVKASKPLSTISSNSI